MLPLLTVAFFSKTDSINFLVQKDQHRSLPAFASSNVATRIRFITKRPSLFRLSHTSPPIGSSHDSLSLTGDCLAYHVPHAYQSRLGSAFSPVVLISTSEDVVTSEPDHLPFWFKPLSIFGVFALTTFIGSSLSLAMLLNSSPATALMLAVQVHCPKRLRTSPLPATHALVESCW